MNENLFSGTSRCRITLLVCTTVFLHLVVIACFVLTPVDFGFWTLRLISLELWRQILGSKQVELWVCDLFVRLFTIKLPIGQGQYDWWPLLKLKLVLDDGRIWISLAS